MKKILLSFLIVVSAITCLNGATVKKRAQQLHAKQSNNKIEEKLLNEASRYFENEFYEAAENCYDKIYSRFGLSMSDYFQYASACNHNGNHKKCIRLCEKIISDHENGLIDLEWRYSFFLFLVGQSYCSALMYDEAIIAVQKYIPLQEDEESKAQGYWKLGEIYFHKEKYDSSIEWFEKYLKYKENHMFKPETEEQRKKLMILCGDMELIALVYELNEDIENCRLSLKKAAWVYSLILGLEWKDVYAGNCSRYDERMAGFFSKLAFSFKETQKGWWKYMKLAKLWGSEDARKMLELQEEIERLESYGY